MEDYIVTFLRIILRKQTMSSSRTSCTPMKTNLTNLAEIMEVQIQTKNNI